METLPILGDLTNDQFESILSICAKKEFPADKVIFKEGEGSSDMYILTNGAVKVMLWGVEISRIFPINTIGEMGIFTDEVRSATLVTLTKCTLLKMTKVDLFGLFKKDNKLYTQFQKSIMQDMAKKLRTSNEVIAKLKSELGRKK
ncbi:Crp/Fnr family transcriptional regulator [Candidatus Latescibacterota bacterium]